MPPGPQIWIANTEEEKFVQNLSSIAQNYGTIFILKFENDRVTCLHLQNLNCEYQGREGCKKFRISCTKLY